MAEAQTALAPPGYGPYQRTDNPSRKNRPVGPSSGRSASQIAVSAPSSGVRVAASQHARVDQHARIVHQHIHAADLVDRGPEALDPGHIHPERLRADLLGDRTPGFEVAHPDHHAMPARHQPRRDGAPDAAIAARHQRGRSVGSSHHRSFKVASPISARISEMIQNRITTCGSAQPFFSK
jgi:hypothetical protein